jgi:hypothetical protein
MYNFSLLSYVFLLAVWLRLVIAIRTVRVHGVDSYECKNARSSLLMILMIVPWLTLKKIHQ